MKNSNDLTGLVNQMNATLGKEREAYLRSMVRLEKKIHDIKGSANQLNATLGKERDAHHRSTVRLEKKIHGIKGSANQINATLINERQAYHSSMGQYDRCRSYMRDTGCGWNSEYRCPEQTGSGAVAGDDGSIGYTCCCKLWTHAGQK